MVRPFKLVTAVPFDRTRTRSFQTEEACRTAYAALSASVRPHAAMYQHFPAYGWRRFYADSPVQ